MRDIANDIDHWLQRDEPIALATVVSTWGSAPRGVGARMAFTRSGEITGSVSGGCVEGAVVEAGLEALSQGRARRIRFGVDDATAWGVGLACGGRIEVFVQPLVQIPYQMLRSALEGNRRFAITTLIEGPSAMLGQSFVIYEDREVFGDVSEAWAEAARDAAARLFEGGASKVVPFKAQGGRTVGDRGVSSWEAFVDVIDPPLTLVVIGGAHIAIALTQIAHALGYRTVIVDPRRAFATEGRFPHVDKILHAWPDEALSEFDLTRSTAVATLSHDPKLDDPALMLALKSPAFYIGALGSRKTQAQRRERLLAEGLLEADLLRMHGPIGLDIGANTPEEIALAVMAQITAVRNGKL